MLRPNLDWNRDLGFSGSLNFKEFQLEDKVCALGQVEIP